MGSSGCHGNSLQECEVIMPNNMQHVMQQEFGRQNIFRTVSVGFNPYLPFTQGYRMTLSQQSASMAGASNIGYFTLQPEDRAGLGDDERDGYPWVIRRQIYMGEGDGRVGYMSRLMNREERAVEAAGEVKAQASSSVMGSQLATLLGSGSTLPAWLGQRSSQFRAELEVQFLDQLYREAGMGSPAGPTGITRRQGFRDYGRSKDFDKYLEDHDSFAHFLQDTMDGNITDGQFDRALTLSAEMEDRDQRSYSSKILGQINTDGMNLATTRLEWATHVQDEIHDMNTRIRRTYQREIGLTGGNADDWEAAKRAYGHAGTTSGIHYETRQFLNRAQRDYDMYLDNNLREVASHVVINQLGNGYIGFVKFWPTRDADGIPQLGWAGVGQSGQQLANSVAVLGGITSGRVINAFSSWGIRTATIRGIDVSTLASEALNRATSVAVSKPTRTAAVGSFMTTTMATALKDNIDIRVGWDANDRTHLTPMAIAESIRQQIIDFYDTPDFTSAFGQWYQDLMNESNALTQAWHDAVPPGPVNGWPISTEFQFGDDAGNPRKHYLGVWNKEGEDAWKGGDMSTGYNFSISPMVISRREGTVKFG